MDGLLGIIKKLDNMADGRDIILLLLHLTPVNYELAERFGIDKNNLTQMISKLREEGYKIHFDPRGRYYYLIETVPNNYPVKIIRKIGRDKYYGLLYGVVNTVVECSEPLKENKPYLIRSVIRGLKGDMVYLRGVEY